jgi:gliding motility-associated-like protein
MKKVIFTLLASFSTYFSYAQVNDQCGNASNLTVFTACTPVNGTTVGATPSTTTPSCAGNADDDVWYKFTATNSIATINVQGSATFDAVVELLSGTCGTFTSLNCEDVGFSGGLETINAVGLTPGTVYYIRVHDYYAASPGTFTICVSGPASSSIPINNEPCAAIMLPPVDASCNYLRFSSANATGSVGVGVPTPASCVGGGAPQMGGFTSASGDVWFTVIVPPNGKLSLAGENSYGLSDGVMALYTGTCGALTQVACSDDPTLGSANFTIPLINKSGLVAGSTVFIRYWGYGVTKGNFGICVSSPENDACSTALDLCDLNGYSSSTSYAFTVDRPCNMAGNGEDPASGYAVTSTTIDRGGPFGHAPSFPGGVGSAAFGVGLNNNSWLKFIADGPTATLNVNVSNCWRSTVSPPVASGCQMQIFSTTGACCGFTPVSDFKEDDVPYTITAKNLTIGATYYLMVDGFANDICNYTITAISGVNVGNIAPSSDSICVGQPVTLTAPAGGTSYAWAPGGQTTSSITVSPSSTTTYTVSVEGYCGKKQSRTQKIFVAPVPAPNIAPNVAVGCKGGSSTYSVTAIAGTTYTWLLTGGTIASGQGTNTLTINWGVGATGTIKIVQRNGIGCTGRDSIMNITLTNAPNANFGYTSPVCAGTPVLLNPIFAAGAVAGTFSSTAGLVMTPGNGIIGTTLSTAGTYIVTNTVAASGGCPAVTDTAKIIINAVPKPAITPITPKGCKGGTSTFSVTPVVGSTYTWVVNGGTIASGAGTNTVTVTWGSGLTGTIKITQKNAAGCDGKDSVINIILDTAPNANFSYTSPVCAGSPVLLNPIMAAGATTGTFSSTSGLVMTPGNGIIGTTLSTPGTYIVTNTISASGGCPAVSDTAKVTINPKPTLTLTAASATVCANATGTYYAVTSAGTTLNWIVKGGTLTTGQANDTITATWGQLSPGKVIVEATNTFGCKRKDSLTVTINPLPTKVVPIVAANDTICAGNSITINVTPQAGVTYTVYDKSTGGTVLGTVPFTSPKLNDSLWYYIESKSTSGCLASTIRDSVRIVVNPRPVKPILTFMPNDSICKGLVAVIKGTTIPGVITSVYSSVSGGIPLGTLDYTTAPIVTNTSYYLETKITQTGCTYHDYRDTVTIHVVDRPLKATLQVQPSNAICLYDSVKLKAVSIGSTINWYDTNNGTTAIGKDSVKVSPPKTQWYYVEVKNAFGCKASDERDSVLITIMPLPDLPTLTGKTDDICEGDSIVLKATVNPINATIYWLSGTTWRDTISKGTDFTSPILTTSTTYYLGSISNFGCKNFGPFLAIPVVIKPLPHVTVSTNMPNNTVYEGQAITFDAQPATFDSYTWYIDPKQITIGNHLFETQDVKDNDLVKVLVTEKGCKNWGDNTINVKVLPISNAFTPNGDGKNDVFLKGIDLRIYNRWGQQLYSGLDGWDGKFNGTTVSAGTYYYMIKIKKLNSDEVVEKNGSITVILD